MTNNNLMIGIPDHIVLSHMGYELNKSKVNNLFEFGSNLNIKINLPSIYTSGVDGRVYETIPTQTIHGRDKIYHLFSIPKKEKRIEIGDELINFLIGPVAERYNIFGNCPLLMNNAKFPFLYILIELLELGLLPSHIRKEFYPKFLEMVDITTLPSHQLIDTDTIPKLDDIPLKIARDNTYALLKEIQSLYDTSDIEISKIVKEIIFDNPAQAVSAKSDQKVIGWFIGQTMKRFNTKIDPNKIRDIIIRELQ